ncbi:relaxase/mobilization nuclease domain-containing protein [Companilactobacillus sp. HBUAS59699]|uniref:relaxase/mobilization nuclease domain-containing protein n=1 Tax=Companilactobacillus sp. HBUAS59699 TaxID=3109358 RepID=UPI002FF3F297
MTYVKSNSSTSAWSRLHYIFDEEAHDGSRHRVLAVEGSHINLWRSASGQPYVDQSGYYLNSQFKNMRRRARNKNKRHQAQHLILSFSESEFPTTGSSDLVDKSHQINQLVKGFMDENFPGTQWVSAVQCDGKGYKLHAHVLVNTVKVSGKCVQTNKFSVSKLRNEWNHYMNEHYLSVTGHLYLNPMKQSKTTSNTNLSGWQKELKEKLDWAKKVANSLEKYVDLLSTKNVTVKQRNKKGAWSYVTEAGGKKRTVRDFYQRKNKKTGEVRSTRGMGIEYTPLELKKYFKSKQHETDSSQKNHTKEVTNYGRSKRVDERRRQQRIIQGAIQQSAESGDKTGYSKSGGRNRKSTEQSQLSSDFER